MVAGSILPVAIVNNKLYFLFGKENPFEDSSKGWSDFGGGAEKNETPIQTALREGSEEMTGFLGDAKKIQQRIRKSRGTYDFEHNKYHVHIFLMDYDKELPEYYNDNHAFLWERMDSKLLNDTKLFEKMEIDWFSEEDLVNRRAEFRNFYREIVDKLREQIPEIKKWCAKRTRRSRTTTKRRRTINKRSSTRRNKSRKPFKFFGGK